MGNVVDKGTSFLFHVNRYVAGSETDMYKHGYAELLYVSDGSLTEHVCGDKMHIKKGDVCFIDSGCVHKESFEEDDTFVIRLEVSDEIINAVISNAMADKQAVDYIKELVKALKNSGYQVEGFECARDFYKKLEEKQPDLALLDIMLPDEDGLEIVAKLRRRPETKKLPIIMVTAKSTEIDKVKGLDVGADDYLTKPFGVMELIARVKAVLRRTMEEDKFLTLGDIFLDDEKHMVYVKDIPCSLTFKEYELLKLLLHNAGIVVTREIILERVWGIDFEGESRTLDMHIRTLRQKLGEAGSMIRTVRNVGYMIE